MKISQKLLIAGLITLLIGLSCLICNLWYYYSDYLTAVAPMLMGAGGLLLGSGIGHNSSDNTYLIKNIRNGKQFDVLKTVWGEEHADGKTVLCLMEQNYYFLLYLPKWVYANEPVEEKTFIKHGDKIYRQ